MPKNKLRVESNERIDIQDFEFLALEGIHDNTEQLLENLACSSNRTKQWVLSGFAMSNPSAKQLQATKGKAILAERRDGSVRYGMLVTEGDATKIVDLNTYAAGDYGIYIRFEAVPGDAESRMFWNPAGDGSEFANTVNTRYLANWSLRVESASPGAEWMRIGEVAQATMDITDEREFYFEGSLPDSYESGWSADGGGMANDRNADRSTYGITDLQGFTAATRQCLTDIKGRGLREWYERDIGGMNIGFDADPVEGKLALGDAGYFLGLSGSSNPQINFDSEDYLEFTRSTSTMKLTFATSDSYNWTASAFAPIGTRDLGASGARWDSSYFNAIDGKTAEITSDNVTADTGSPDIPITSNGGDVTHASNSSNAATALAGYGGDAGAGGGNGGYGLYARGGVASGGGDGGNGGQFLGGGSTDAASGYGIYAAGGDADSASGTANCGGYFVGGIPFAGSGDSGIAGIKTTGGVGEGSFLGGAGIAAYGGAGGATGAGGMGGYFAGADSNGSGSGGMGVTIAGGYGASGEDSGAGLLVNTQTITTTAGSPGYGAYIEAGAISNASNPNDGGDALEVRGGGVNAGGGTGGYGIISLGGNSGADYGGPGLLSTGGNGTGSGKYGGYGVKAIGGNGSSSAVGAPGIYAQGGTDGTYDGPGGQFAGGTNAAAINLVARSGDPGSPSNGDIWYTGTALKCHLNNTTYTIDVT